MDCLKELDKISNLPVLVHSLKKETLKATGGNWDGITLKAYTQEWIDIGYLHYAFEISHNQCSIYVYMDMNGKVDFIEHESTSTQKAIEKAVKEFYRRYSK